MVPDLVKKLTGDAYGLAALMCLRHLGVELQDPKIDGWMDCSMENGAKGWDALHTMWRENAKRLEWHNDYRTISLTSRDKRYFPPLQAADILAYELYQQADLLFGENPRPMRYPLMALAAGKRNKWLFAQEQHIRAFSDDVTKQLRAWGSR